MENFVYDDLETSSSDNGNGCETDADNESNHESGNE